MIGGGAQDVTLSLSNRHSVYARRVTSSEKLNRHLVKLWRSMGIRSFVYIDERIGIGDWHQSFRASNDISLRTIRVLINEEKIHLDSFEVFILIKFYTEFNHNANFRGKLKMIKVL